MKEGLQLFCFDCSHCYDCIQRIGKSCADRSGLHQYKRTLDAQCYVCHGPNEMAKLRAENERYRTALESIASDEPEWGDRWTAAKHISIARKALGMENDE